MIQSSAARRRPGKDASTTVCVNCFVSSQRRKRSRTLSTPSSVTSRIDPTLIGGGGPQRMPVNTYAQRTSASPVSTFQIHSGGAAISTWRS